MNDVKPQRWRVIEATFEKSATAAKQLADDGIVEIAFAGRSNAGKSSLLNALCRHRSLARVSKTPGRTQAINLFLIRLRAEDTLQEITLRFADLPGYGYAKVGASMRESWRRLISDYIESRRELARIVLVHDCRREISEEESWFFEYGVCPAVLVLSKADKISKSEIAKAKKAAFTALPANALVVPVSSQRSDDPGLYELAAILAADGLS